MSREKIVGLYAGTFDPVTNGHMNIIQRAARLVDVLHIAVAENPGKNPLLDVTTRVGLIKHNLSQLPALVNIEVDYYRGLTTDIARQLGAQIMFRGMRPVGDFEHEYNIQQINRLLVPDLETVWLMADPTHQSISSSMVKELVKHGSDVSRFVSPVVRERLEQRDDA